MRIVVDGEAGEGPAGCRTDAPLQEHMEGDEGEAMFRHALSRNGPTAAIRPPVPQLGEGEEPELCAAMTMVASEHLPPQLEGCVSVVRQWLDKITAASTNPDLDLRNSGQC